MVVVLLAAVCAGPPSAARRDAATVTLSISTTDAVDLVAPDARTPWSHEYSVRRIAATFETLHLPLPPEITVHVVDAPHDFARGLVDTAGVAPALAEEVSRFAVGVSAGGRLFVRESEARRGRRAWLRLLAHEMAHLAQVELAGGRRCGARWVSEGMAEWVAFAVLDRLGIDGMTDVRATVRASGWRALARTAHQPLLPAIGDARTFLHRAEALGVVPMYHLAYVLVERLVERQGAASLAAYYRECPAHQDERQRFARAFTERLEDFERDVVAAVTGH